VSLLSEFVASLALHGSRCSLLNVWLGRIAKSSGDLLNPGLRLPLLQAAGPSARDRIRLGEIAGPDDRIGDDRMAGSGRLAGGFGSAPRV
jgi:hypothetical protein